MPNLWVPGPPGVRAPVTSGHRTVLAGFDYTYLPGGKLANGTLSGDAGNTGDTRTLRAGKFMGKISATGLYRNSFWGKSTVAYADNDTTITVGVATAVEIARIKTAGGGGNLSGIFVGPPSAAGTVAETAITITAVDTTAGTITTGDLNLNKVIDSLIGPADGAIYPASFIPDGWPGDIWKMVDNSGADLPVVPFPHFPIAGVVRTTQFLDVPADASTLAWLKQKLNDTATGAQGKFVWDGQF